MRVKYEFEVTDDFQLGDCLYCPMVEYTEDAEGFYNYTCFLENDSSKSCPLKVVDDKLEKLIDEFNAVGSINPMSASEIEAMIKEVENNNDDD